MTNKNNIDVEPIIEHLNSGDTSGMGAPAAYYEQGGLFRTQLFVGGYPLADFAHADFTLLIDRLNIDDPKPSADAGELNQILSDFTRHLRGEVTLDDTQLDEGIEAFLVAFDGSWEPISGASLE